MAVALLFTGLTRHPKIRRAGEAAGWMFVCCLEYAAEFDTNGFIPSDAVAAFGLRRTQERLAKLLVQDARMGPLLHRVDGGYRIHDYLEWNRRAEDLAERRKAKSQARSEAGKKGAAARWGTGKLLPDDGNRHGKPMANANGQAIANDGKPEWQTDGPSSCSSSVSSSSVGNPPSTDARANGKTRGRSSPVADSVRQARRRATGSPDPPLDGWDAASLTRIAQQAAERFDVDHQVAYDRLLVLAAIGDTRSPGRLLEPAGWDLAGAETRRIAADAARQRRQDAADQARRADAAVADSQTTDRRATVAALADSDPDGWHQALAAATAALQAAGTHPVQPLVETTAIAHYRSHQETLPT